MGFNQHQGQDLVQGESIQQTLDNLKLLKEIGIVHVPGQQKGVNFEARGNSEITDETVKQAALTLEVPVLSLIQHLPAFPLPLSLPLPRKNN
jgi:hypothetical protein